MVVASITLMGLVAFRFLDAQDNTEIADTTSTSQQRIAAIQETADIDTTIKLLDSEELDSTLDADLDAELDF